MQILGTPQKAQPRASLDTRSVTDSWTLLSWVGAGFLIMGFFDIALGWYPTSFGNPEWEFGVISGALNAFALPMLALYLILASAVARRRIVVLRVMVAVFVVLAVILLVLAVLYALTIPVALNSVSQNPTLQSGMKRAVLKGCMLFVTYLALFGIAASRAWRSTRQPSTS